MTFEFYLPKNGSLKNIHLQLTDEKQKQSYHFRTSLRIVAEDWDYKRKRPANIYIKKYKKINNYLNDIRIRLTEKLLEKKNIGQRTLAREIEKICAGNQPVLSEQSLLYFMKQYIDTKKELICNSTYKRYMVFLHLTQRFEAFVGGRLLIKDINTDFVKDFIAFGREEEYSENTIYRSIYFVKTILNFVEKKGIRTCVRELDICREKQQKEVITLSRQEITQIKETTVPQDLQPAKDWLLISCYTGQRFSDFMYFSKDQMCFINEKACLSFVQKKTQKNIILPLHPTVIEIMERNNNNFPKPIDIWQYNSDIKRIAQLSNLNTHIKARKRFGFRAKTVLTEKWQIISSHIGRRSFATNFYGKIPTPLLMDATGHSTEQMFLRYINPVDNDRIVSLSNYFEKCVS